MKQSNIMMDNAVSQKTPIMKFVLPVLVLIIIALGGLSYYLYTELGNLKKNPQQAAQKEVADLLNQVGKLVVLPEGENPTVATVADPEKLKEQPFFSRAKKGDKVLIYTNARKAILYDPVNNKIVEIAPINIGNTGASQPQP